MTKKQPLREFHHVVHAHCNERFSAFRMPERFRKLNMKRKLYLHLQQLGFSDTPFAEGEPFLAVEVDREITGVDAFWCKMTDRMVVFVFTNNTVFMATGKHGDAFVYRFNVFSHSVYHVLARLIANMPNKLYPGLESLLFHLVKAAFPGLMEIQWMNYCAVSGAPSVEECLRVVVDPKFFPKVKLYRDSSVYNVDLEAFTEVPMGQ